jgi:hypothetical protein
LSRVDPGLSHEDKVPLQAIDSTIITLVQNEKEFILNKWPNGAIQLRTQAFVSIFDLHVWCVKCVYLASVETS